MMTTRIGNSRMTRSRVLLAACGLAIGMTASSALGQVVWQEAERAPGAARSETMVSIGDNHTITARGTTADGRSYDIKIKNDDARATLDGRAVPANRIVRHSDKVELLDERGNVVVSIGTIVPPTPSAPVPPSAQGVTRSLTLRPAWKTDSGTLEIETHVDDGGTALARVFGATAQEPPKVMVGITMSGVDETLRAHFGLPEGAGIVVDDVFEGLPAARAGVQARDIIVSIDGKEVSNMALRGSLEGKEPGQRVKVRVIRKGESKDLDMLLDAYDPAKLGNQTGGSRGTGFFGEAPDGELHGFTFEIDSDTSRAMREAQRALEEAMATMNAQGMENQAEALNAAREQMRKAISEMQMHRYTLPNGEREIIMVPTAPAAPAFPGAPARPSTPRASGEGEDRARQAAREFQVMRGPRSTSPASASNTDQLTTLERRLDSLDQRFNRLDERIGKLLDRLERDE